MTTPADHIVRAAKVYRKTEKEAIAAPPAERAKAKDAHRHAKRHLSMVVDLAEAKEAK